jgi:hypothetical protein
MEGQGVLGDMMFGNGQACAMAGTWHDDIWDMKASQDDDEDREARNRR